MSRETRRREGPQKDGVASLMKIDKVARRLDVTPRTVRNWIAGGDLPAYRLGGVVRVSTEDLEEFIRQGRNR